MVDSRMYPVEVKEVYSADDLQVMVDLMIGGQHLLRRARLHGVDAPDAFKKAPDSEEGKLRDEVRRLVRGSCKISVIKEMKGDLIVNLFYEKNGETINLNKELIGRGYVFTHPER